ncbi:MAG TPA: hypothetical protein DCZ94_10880 [Lentisphaeria bacterium]|nr:MAG: hypothetical protein A2X48_06760 [Lentisphaerae bacterium GWF2_49_21]HBC87449.1 hypothetical protein [Lentisphaeria bacterium]
MWQFLPEDVISVVAGNDGRLWLQVLDDSEGKDIEKIKQNINDEFLKTSPSLRGCMPILFESGKRIWFTNLKKDILLGYDGEIWIERKAEKDHYFNGVLPSQIRKGKSFNLFLNGRAFFIDSLGILSFDGEKWDYRQMGQYSHAKSNYSYPMLLPTSDMKGVIAFFKSSIPPDTVISNHQGNIIRSRHTWEKEFFLMEFRDDKWKSLEIPTCLNQAEIDFIMPRSNGMIIGMKGRNIFFFQDKPPMEKFNSLLSKLSDGDFNVREKATSELATLGIVFWNSISDAQKEAKDPEVKNRLSKVLEMLKEKQENSLEQEISFAIGDYVLINPTMVSYDALARIFITSPDVRGKAGDEILGPGLLIIDADGKTGFLKGKKFTEGWEKTFSDKTYLDRGIPHPLPSIFWLESDNAIRILDIDKRDFIYETNELSFSWLHCATSDGMFICSRGGPFYYPSMIKPVAVFKHSAKDERKLLASQQVKILDNLFLFFTKDGIWIKNPEGEVLMFDGKKWKDFPELKDASYANIKIAKDGTFISTGKPFCFMYADGKISTTNSPDQLIFENLKTIENHFDEKAKNFTCDGSGNIWFFKSENELMIYNNRSNYNLLEKHAETFSKCSVNHFKGIAKNKVLIHYSLQGQGFFTLVCEKKNGKYFFNKIPTSSVHDYFKLIYDFEGKLWYNAESPSSTQLTFRIGEEEKIQEIIDSGIPFLCDKSGNVWLGDIIRQTKNKFNIWRKGEIKGSVEIPHANEASTLISDREGSVIAITGPLVTHLTAENTENPAEYKVKAEYWLDVKGKLGTPQGFRLGDKFYIGVSSWTSNNKEYFLNIIEFPPSEGK